MNVANELLHLSATGLAFITEQEGLRLSAYPDRKGVPTIGVGHTGKHVHLGQVITRSDSDAFLSADALEAERWVKEYVNVALNQGKFDSLTSFVFNEGAGHFHKSSLLALINTHGGQAAIEQAFGRWVLINGVRSDDLIRRRKAEAEMFNG